MYSELLIVAFGISAIAGYFSKSSGYIGALLSSLAFLALELHSADYLSYFGVITSAVWAIISLYSVWYGRKYGKWLSSLLPFMMMGMVIILVSTNYLELIAGWEVMSVPAYLMVALNSRSDNPPFTFMVFSEFSTILLIGGAAYAYLITGSLTIGPVGSYVPLLLISIGSMIKMGMTPFMLSEWLPIANGRTPSNASAVLSASMTLMGVYLIMRMIMSTPLYTGLGILFLSVGSVTILFSSMYAYISENMKMLAGFSTIENNAAILSAMGLYMIVTTSVLREFVAITILLFSLAHSLSKTGIFMSIGNTDAEYFGQIDHPTSSSQRFGTFMAGMSLSGILPTIGGLGTWMLLEAFFMQAYLGGVVGIISIIVGSVVALSEGMATGGMMKVFAFGTLFRKTRSRKATPGEIILAFVGISTIGLFAVSTLFFPPSFISGMPSIGILKGTMILSKFGPADFGLTTPDFLLGIVAAFSLGIYALIGKPVTREVPVWHGGGDEYMEPYTSYTYSNNIRLLMRRLLKTNFEKDGTANTLVDRFYLLMVRIASGYREFSKFVILNVMNSSIGWYMIYMIAGFLAVILVSVAVF